MLPPGVEFPAVHRWPVTLRAGGLVLRGLRLRDRAAWDEVRWRNRDWLAEWDATTPIGSPPPGTFAQMVRGQRAAARDGSALPLAMWWDDRWPGRGSSRRWRLIGQVSVGSIAWGSARMAPVGYWIDEAFAGRGLMPTAVALAGDYCFQVLGLHRLEINIRPENAPSLRVVEKLGFRYEGERPRYLHINGDWRDHLSFALTSDEATDGLLVRYLAGRGLPES